MSEESVETVVMSVNGQEYDCGTFSVAKNTGNKVRPTMNRQLRAKHKGKGIKTFEISCSVIIPDGKDTIEWEDIEDARISIESITGGFRETYIDCSTITCSDAYDVAGDSRRDLTLFALDCIKESI